MACLYTVDAEVVTLLDTLVVKADDAWLDFRSHRNYDATFQSQITFFFFSKMMQKKKIYNQGLCEKLDFSI